jgi:hypothetical protein
MKKLILTGLISCCSIAMIGCASEPASTTTTTTSEETVVHPAPPQ